MIIKFPKIEAPTRLFETVPCGILFNWNGSAYIKIDKNKVINMNNMKVYDVESNKVICNYTEYPNAIIILEPTEDEYQDR